MDWLKMMCRSDLCQTGTNVPRTTINTFQSTLYIDNERKKKTGSCIVNLRPYMLSTYISIGV